MSNINNSLYFGSVSVTFDENNEMIISQDQGDFKISQMLVLEGVEYVKRLVISQRNEDGSYTNKQII